MRKLPSSSTVRMKQMVGRGIGELERDRSIRGSECCSYHCAIL